MAPSPWVTFTSIKKTSTTEYPLWTSCSVFDHLHRTDLQSFSVGSQHTSCEMMGWVSHTCYSVLAMEPLHSSLAAKPLTHTSSLSFSATAIFLTGLLSPFAGPVGCSCQSHLPYSGCGKCFSLCWPVSLVVSKAFWYPSLEDLLCSSSCWIELFFSTPLVPLSHAGYLPCFTKASIPSFSVLTKAAATTSSSCHSWQSRLWRKQMKRAIHMPCHCYSCCCHLCDFSFPSSLPV